MNDDVRSLFEITKTKTFLNNASHGPHPEPARRAMVDYFARRATNDIPEEELGAVVEETRDELARLVGAPRETVSIVGNTTMGLSLITAAYPFEPGDEVLVLDRCFPSAVLPWLHLRGRGVEVRLVPADRYPDLERALDMVTPSTRLLAASWVRFFDGYRMDLGEWAAALHERGVRFVVDGMQGLGVVDVDLPATCVDAMAAGGAKWLLSPCGTGLLYVAPEFRRELTMPFAGWMQMIEWEAFDDGHFLDYDVHDPGDGRAFEAGTYPFGLLVGMRESVRLLNEVGIANIEKHVQGLLDRLVERVEAIPGCGVRSDLSSGHRSGIISLETPDPRVDTERLLANDVIVSYRQGGIRVSPYLFNDEDDIERLVDVLAGDT
ncbi:MAG: aminotransferase class V-fold PLP-dependent enzyme [Candidatus Coatesbacteria bacterium]|nr:MAG: aminotransferase class V-fold PLP-dependent enzyme [Candidatus Coatesbacteria bacterium]